MRRVLGLPVLIVACWLTSVRATSWDYTIAVPEGREGTYELPFVVEHAGVVTIDARWTGPRLLFFGVEGPGHVSMARRSGPSPQSLELQADDATIARGTAWRLTIKALPARGEANGHLQITAPDAPEVVARREAELHPPPPPPPPPPSWMLTRNAPPGASPAVTRVFAAVESFRGAVLPATDGPDDACSWQLEFLRYAAASRDRLGDRNAQPDIPTLRYFARLAEAIRGVDTLRTETDPVIAGPAPADREQRRDWLIARSEIVRPIVRSLDVLTELLRGGYAPALEDEPWLPRLTACLTACERFFDERVRIGGEAGAANRQLTAAQWDRILAAGRVLSSFEAFLQEPRPPDR